MNERRKITRRRMLAVSALGLPLACKPPPAASPPPAAVPPPLLGKKGLCLSSRGRPSEKIALFLDATRSRWLYNWNVEPPENHSASIPFTPMIYRAGAGFAEQVARVKALAASAGYRELLGFNEPDAESQGNMSVEDALAAWPKLEATGLRLGSPGCVHPDNEWMLAFMKGVEQRRLRVDFVCVHSYGGPGVDSLARRLEKVHALFNRPIWITEFAVADWDAKAPARNRFSEERVADFVAGILPRLEAMDFVERYSWFHGGVSGEPLRSSRLFHPDGSLTLVGKAYRDSDTSRA